MTRDSPSGVLVVDKPSGMTSHDVVSRVRRLARTRKVGHAGTLDPMATGVLVLGLNRATRLLGHLALTEKGYDATVRLGAATTTDDAEGEPVSTTSARGLDAATVRGAFAGFVGDIEQVPSAVSAVKVDGVRAYARVRAGEQVRLAARPVTVHEIVVHDLEPVGELLDVRLSVRCSSGTYVRALARDVGDVLGVGGHLTALRRTSVGPVSLADAVALGDAEAAAEVTPMTMEDAAARFFPTVEVDDGEARDVGHGRPLERDLGSTDVVAVLGPDGRFLALYRQAGAVARPVAVLA